MADEEQLDILNRGTEAWNAWRQEAEPTVIDLSRAILAGANLHGANLEEANLRLANLTGTKLSYASLRGAHPRSADLQGANLRGANLEEANLRLANLTGANLTFANLIGVDLGTNDVDPYSDASTLFRAKISAKISNVVANLGGANLSGANLAANFARTLFSEAKADLSGPNLRWAHLSRANLAANFARTLFRGARTDLSGANLRWAKLSGANLRGANLHGADLRMANFGRATLHGANLTGADLSGANLRGADLSAADLSDADLTGCQIFGVSAWRLRLSEGTKQQNLVITAHGEPAITADDIEVAQFLYLLIHNEKLRKVIDTITSKVVLILGRFSEERKAVLDAMREALRKRDLLPVIFDFAVPSSRDVTETVRVVASLARYVVADITDATEVRSELNFVPDFPSLPVQPILLRGRPEPVGIPHWRRYPWFLPSFEYDSAEHLLANLNDCVIAPVEAKARELQRQPPRL